VTLGQNLDELLVGAVPQIARAMVFHRPNAGQQMLFFLGFCFRARCILDRPPRRRVAIDAMVDTEAEKSRPLSPQ